MNIDHQPITQDSLPYIIAELGVNHNGSLETALELTRGAADAGADAIKLQLFRADLLMSRASTLAEYQSAAGETDPRAMLRRLELSVEQLAPIVALAHDLDIHAIVTVFNLELVESANGLAWDAFKTASPDIVHRPLLEALAATNRPLIVSTGASTLREVGRALNWLRHRRDDLAVLQCVSCYPTPDSDAELGGILALQDIFPGPVGYSDHTAGINVVADAVRLGARILEKHFTLDKDAKGPDHAASLTPGEFAQYCDAARGAFAAARSDNPKPGAKRTNKSTSTRTLPKPQNAASSTDPHALHEKYPALKRVISIEEDVRRVSRQSIIAHRDLPKGHILQREDITFKRPGTGLAPWELDSILGQPLVHAALADEPLRAASAIAPADAIE